MSSCSLPRIMGEVVLFRMVTAVPIGPFSNLKPTEEAHKTFAALHIIKPRRTTATQR